MTRASYSPHDVREVANFVLQRSFDQKITVTNLSLNKILYFLHAAFLQELDRPLIGAKIEAWNHGPVYREIYHQFKRFGSNRIVELARKLDPNTGRYEIVRTGFNESERRFLDARCDELLRISAGKLVDMAHISDGPWHRARYNDGSVNPGVEITNEMIRDPLEIESRH